MHTSDNRNSLIGNVSWIGCWKTAQWCKGKNSELLSAYIYRQAYQNLWHLYLIFTTKDRVKGHSQRLCSVCRQRHCTSKAVKFWTVYCWKCDGGPWVCGFAEWDLVTRCLLWSVCFYWWQCCSWVYCFASTDTNLRAFLLDSPTVPVRWITLDMRADVCNIGSSCAGQCLGFIWTWILVYSCIRLFLLWGLNFVHQCTFYF